VLIPKASILGAKEYHVQQGTVISLVCIVETVRKPNRKKPMLRVFLIFLNLIECVGFWS